MSSSGPVDRFEVDLRYGAFILRQTDLLLNGAVAVPFTRTYASNDWDHNPIHAFGRKSNHPYDIAPRGTRNPYTYMAILLEDGDSLYFDRISSGSGFADAVYQHTETGTSFYKATTRWNGNGWSTELVNGSAIVFPESYSAKNMAQGAPTKMRDAAGHTLLLQRDRQRNLQRIVAPDGGIIKLFYDDQSRIIRAEKNQQEWVTYRYGADYLLTDVVFSSGAERHYSYDDMRMTAIKDEHGRELLHNYYSGWMVVWQDLADGRHCSYRYRMSPNRDYVESVVVTLPDGEQETVYPGNYVREDVKHPHD